jgi:hypothetical protein
MGIRWVAAIFFAAQAAPLAWRGSNADRQTVWSFALVHVYRRSINLLLFRPLIHMRIVET